MSTTSQGDLTAQQQRKRQNPAHISLYGWTILILLVVLGIINFGDKAVLGLAAVPIIKELHLSPTQYGVVSGSFYWLFGLSSVLVTAWSDSIGTKKVLAALATTWAIIQFATLLVFTFPALLLTRIVLGGGEGPLYGTAISAAVPWVPAERRAFGLGIVTLGGLAAPAMLVPLLALLIVAVGWRPTFALLGGIGILWLIPWLLIAREPAEAGPIPADETQVGRSKIHWSQLFRVICSPTILFLLLAAFVFNWASTLYLSWNPLYLVTVRHLRLSDPLYIAGITLSYIGGGISVIAFSALADRIFRHTGSHRRAYVYLITTVLIVNALCLYLAVHYPSALGAILFLTLAPLGAFVPLQLALITAVTPAAYRGTVLGIIGGVSSLSGFMASLVTGLIIQAAGKNATIGFQNAYLLASVLLLLVGGMVLVFVRPDGERLEEKTSEAEVQLPK